MRGRMTFMRARVSVVLILLATACAADVEGYTTTDRADAQEISAALLDAGEVDTVTTQIFGDIEQPDSLRWWLPAKEQYSVEDLVYEISIPTEEMDLRFRLVADSWATDDISVADRGEEPQEWVYQTSVVAAVFDTPAVAHQLFVSPGATLQNGLEGSERDARCVGRRPEGQGDDQVAAVGRAWESVFYVEVLGISYVDDEDSAQVDAAAAYACHLLDAMMETDVAEGAETSRGS